MYYKIYGVMSKNGFHQELPLGTNSLEKAQASLNDMDTTMFPFFAITEHLSKGSAALALYTGLTKERAACLTLGLVEYKTNPMHNPEAAAILFHKLDEKLKEVQDASSN